MSGEWTDMAVVDEDRSGAFERSGAFQRVADGTEPVGEAAAQAGAQMQPKPPLPMNRADRRARERQDRRAAKLAAIRAGQLRSLSIDGEEVEDL